MAKDETTQHCAFCGQDSDHCRLLSGNGHFICEECVALCYKIMFPEAQYPRVGKDLDAKLENFDCWDLKKFYLFQDLQERRIKLLITFVILPGKTNLKDSEMIQTM